MKKMILLWICALIGVMPLVAQDWVEGTDEALEFDCNVLTKIVAEYNDVVFVKTDKGTASIAEFFADVVPDCVTIEKSEPVEINTESDFSVIVDGNINLRSCAGTNCDVVGQAADGSVLEGLYMCFKELPARVEVKKVIRPVRVA